MAIVTATFAETLPCADCSGLITTLSLWPDSIYRMRGWYGGEGRSHVVSVGRWQSDGSAPGLEADRSVFLGGDDTLRLLDTRGNPIDSSMPLHLACPDTTNVIVDIGEFADNLTYLAEIWLFVSVGRGWYCRCRRRWSISGSGVQWRKPDCLRVRECGSAWRAVSSGSNDYGRKESRWLRSQRVRRPSQRRGLSLEHCAIGMTPAAATVATIQNHERSDRLRQQ